MDASDLLTAAIAVFDAVGTDEFGSKQKHFANLYKRADFAEQGEYHHMWCERMQWPALTP